MRFFSRRKPQDRTRYLGRIGQRRPLQIEMLEDRVTPAVTSTLVGTSLTLQWAATSDIVTMTNNGTNLVFTGITTGTSSFPVGDVTQLTLTGNGTPNQTFTVNDGTATTFANGFSSNQVDTFNFNENVSTGANNFIITNGSTLNLAPVAAATISAAAIGITATNINSSATGVLNGSTSVTLTNTTTSYNPSNTFAGTISGGSFQKSGAGSIILSGTNNYTGTTFVSGGQLRLDTAGAIPGGIGHSGGTSNITFNGGILSLNAGDFTRSVGTGVDQVQWTGDGGFAAFNSDRIVRLSISNTNSAAAFLTWGSGNFVPTASSLLFSSAQANRMVDFQNSFDLGAASRSVNVVRGSSTTFDATLSGQIIGVGGGINRLGALGILALTNASNSYTGDTFLASTGTTNFVSGALGPFGIVRFTVDGGVLQWATGNTLDVSNRVVINNTIEAKFDTNGNNVTFNSSIGASGTGELTKVGSGTLTLAASNTYTGETTVTGGTLAAGVNNAISSGPVTVNNAAATYDIGGFDDTVGAVTISAGTITGTTGVLQTSVANFLLQGGTVSAILGGSAGVTKSSGSTLTLTRANTFSGKVVIQDGEISVASIGLAGTAGPLGTNATIDFGNGSAVGTLIYTGTGETTDRVINLTATTGGGMIQQDGPSGVLKFSSNITSATGQSSGGSKTLTLSGSGMGEIGGVILDFDTANLKRTALTKSGAGTWTLLSANTGTNAYSGTTTVSGGTLALGVSDALSDGALTFGTAGATLSLGTFSDTVAAVTMSAAASITGTTGVLTTTGNYTFSHTSGSANVSAILAGVGQTLTKTGNGSLTLSGVNTYTGKTTISAGTVTVSSIGSVGVAGGFGAPAIGNATIDLGNTAVTTLIYVGGSNETTDRVLNLAGTTFGVTLQQDGGGLLKFASNATATGSGGKTLTLQGTGTAEFAGIIPNSGSATSLTKAQAGTWTLSGANSYTGQTTVSAGTLVIASTGSVSTGATSVTGTLQLQNPSALSNSALTLNNGSTLQLRSDLSATFLTSGAISVPSAASVTLDVDRISSGTGVVLNVGAISAAAGTAETINVTGANGYSLGTGALTMGAAITIAPTTASVAIASAAGAFLLTLGGTNTGNNSVGVISPAGASLTKSNSSAWTLTGTNTYTGATTVAGGTLSVAAGGSLNGTTIGFTGAVAGTLFNVTTTNGLTGTTVLNVNDADATAWLASANNFTGATNLTLGALRLSDAGAMASSVLTISGGTLQLRNDSPTTFATGGANILFSGDPTLTIDVDRLTPGAGAVLGIGSSTYPTGTVLNLSVTGNVMGTGSSLSMGAIAPATGGSTTIDLNVIPTTASIAIASFSNPVGSNNPLELLGTATGNSIGNVTITGGNGVIKSTSSTWTMTGTSNSYTGATAVSGGTLIVTGTLPNTPVNLSGGTLSLQNAGVISQNLITVSGTGNLLETVNGAISGTAALTVNGTAGVTAVTLVNTHSYTGATTVTAGTLNLNVAGAINGSNISVNGAGGVLNATATDAITGTGTLTVTNGAATLSAANNFTGNTTATGGILTLSHVGALASSNLKLNAGTLQLRSDTPATFATASVAVIASLSTIDVNQLTTGNSGNALTLGGAFSSVGATTNVTGGSGYSLDIGALTMTGTTTFNPTTASMAIASATSDTARLLTLGGTATGNTVGIITNGSGATALSKSNTGTWTLTAANTYTGTTTVSGGTLIVTGSFDGTTGTTLGVTGSGTLSLQSAGAYTKGILSVSGGTLNQTIANAISSSAALTIDNVNSIANLSFANNFSGVTTLSAGTLNLTAAGAINGSAITVSGAALLNDAVNNAMTGGTSLRISTGSTTTITHAHDYTGATIIASTGVLNVTGGSLSATNVNFTGATAGATFNLTTTNGLTGTSSITLNDGDGVIVISSANDFTGDTLLSAAGSLTLTNLNAIASSPLKLNAGTLRLRADAPGTFATPNTIVAGTPVTIDVNQLTTGTGHAITLGSAAVTGITINGNQTVNVTGGNGYSLALGLITLTGTTSGSPVIAPSTATVAISTVSGTNQFLNLGGSIAGNTIGPIATGTGTVTKSSTSTWTMTGANTNTATSVTGGTLVLQNANTYVGGTITVTGGTLNESADNAISGNTALTVNNAASVVNLSKSNNYTGATTLSAGTINLTTASAINGSAISVSATGSLLSTVDFALTGSTSLTLATATINLSNANNYLGATTINSGTLNANVAGAITGSAVSVVGGTLNLTAAGALPSSTVTVSGGALAETVANGLSGGSSLTITSGSAVLSQANSYTGDTTLSSSGTLTLSDFGAIASSTLKLNGGTLNLRGDTGGTFTTVNVIVGGTPVAINVNQLSSGTGNALTLGSNAVTGITIGGNQTVNVTGGNGYSLALGLITLTGTTSTGPVIAPSTASVAIAGVNGTNQFLNLGGTATGNTVGNITTGTGTITKSSTSSWTMTGANSNTATSITGGTLLLQNTNAYVSGTITVSGGTLNESASNAISGNTALTVSGGTANLTHANDFTGATTLSAGTINANIAGAFNGSAITVSSTGVLNDAVDNALTGATSLRVNSGTTTITHAHDYTGATIASGSGIINVTGGSLSATAVDFTGATSNAQFNVTTVNGLTGTSSLTVNDGDGTATISAVTNFTGATSMNTGVLRLTALGALTASTLNLNGGILQLRADADGLFATAGISIGASATIDVNQLNTGNTGKTLSLGASSTGTGTLVVTATGGNSYALALGAMTLGVATTITPSTANVSIASVTSSTNQNLTLSGTTTTNTIGAITTGSGTVTKSTAATWTLTGASTYTGTTLITNGIFNVNGGSLSGTLVNLSSATVAGTQFNVQTANGLTGTSSLTLNDADATVNLNASNDYSGATTLTVGTLNLTAAGANSGSIVTVNGAAAVLNPTVANAFSGTGGLTVNGASVVVALNLPNDNAGDTTITAGTLTLNHLGAVASSTIKLNGGTLRLRSDVDGSFGAGVVVGGAATIDVAPATAGANHVLSLGASSIGNVALAITGASGYSLALGATTITGVAAGATFNPTTASVAIASVTGTGQTLTLSGTATGNTVGAITTVGGGVTKPAASTGTWTITGASTYTGATLISAGTLNVSGGSLSGTAISFSSPIAGTTLNVTTANGLTGTTSLAIANANVTVNLNAANNYSGATTLSAGTLNATVAGAIGGSIVTYTGGTLNIAATNALSGTAGLTITGPTVTFATTYDYSGPTTLTSGTLNLNVAGALSASTLTYTGGTLNLAIANALTGTAGLTLNGPTLALSLPMDYTGDTTVTAGTLNVQNPAAIANSAVKLNGGILQLRADANTTFGTGLTVGGAATINVDQLNPGNTDKALSLGGAVSLGNFALSVTGANGYSLGLGAVSLTGASGGSATLNPSTAFVTTGTVTGSTGAGLTLGGSSTGANSVGAVNIGSGPLAKNTAATWTVTAASSLTGDTTISSTGTITFQGPIAGSKLNVNGGTTRLLANTSVAFSNGYSVGASATIHVDQLSAGVSQTISLGAGSIAVSTLTVTGANSYTLALGATTLTGAVVLAPTTASLAVGNVTATNQNLTLGGTATGNSIGAIATGNGTLTKNTAATWTISGASTYAGATTITSGILNVTGSLNGTGIVFTSAVAGAALNVSAVNGLTGATSLNVNDADATVNLDAANDHTGDTTISAGILALNSAAAVATSHLNLNGGTLRLRSDSSVAFVNAGFTIGGGSTIDVNALTSASNRILSLGTSTIAGIGLNVTGGNGYSLNLGTTTLTGSPTFNPTTASLIVGSVSTSPLGANRNVVLAGTASGNVISGLATNGGGLTKNNTSTWTINGASSFTGNTTVNAGSLILAAADAISGGDITVFPAGALVESATNALSGTAALILTFGTNTTLSNANDFTGVTTVAVKALNTTTVTLTNPGALAQSQLYVTTNSTGGGTLNLQLRGDNTATFATAGVYGFETVASPIYNFDVDQLTASGTGKTLTLGGDITFEPLAANPTFNITGGNGYRLGLGTILPVGDVDFTLNPTTASVTVAGFTSTTAGFDLKLHGTAAGNSIGAISIDNGHGVLKTGNSVWTFTGAGTYTGQTVISAGTLIAGVNSALGSHSTIALGDGSTTFGSNPGLLLGSGVTLVQAVAVGASPINTYTLGGANTSGTSQFLGDITLSQPVTLTAANGGVVDFLSNWTTNNKSITVTGAGSSIVRLSSSLTTTASVVVDSGTLSVNGTLTAGNVNVNSGGTLSGTGVIDVTSSNVSVGSGAALAPGNSIGTLTLSSDNLFLSSTSTSNFEINAATPGLSDKVTGIGTLVYGGTLHVTNLGGTLAEGQSWQLFSADFSSGSFANNDSFNDVPNYSGPDLPALGSGLRYHFDYDTGTLSIQEVPTLPTIASVTPFVGPTSGGNFVVIVGTSFATVSGADGVRFYDSVAMSYENAESYVVNSATQITAQVPAQTGISTVDVIVTNFNGSSTNGATDNYTYATPTVTSVVANGLPFATLTGATWTGGNATVTVASTASIGAGYQLSSLGAGFPAYATVAAVTGPTTFTLSAAPMSTQSTPTTIQAVNAPTKSGTVANLSGATWSNGSTTVTVASTANLVAGQYVSSASAGLPANVQIASVTGPTTFELNNPATADQATATTIQVANSAIARDGYGNLVNLSGIGSVVQYLLVTFNMPVTLDSDPLTGVSQAFTLANLPVTSNGVVPTNASVSLTAAGVPGTGSDAIGYSQYVLNFVAGAGVNTLSNADGFGNAFSIVQNGVFQLNTVGSKVHAGHSDTAANRADSFWAFYGVVNPGDIFITGTPGGGNDELRVDGIALSDIYSTFGSLANVANPPYNLAFDHDLDGDVDGIDLTELYENFGTIWYF